jgi:hypothetical protein
LALQVVLHPLEHFLPLRVDQMLLPVQAAQAAQALLPRVCVEHLQRQVALVGLPLQLVMLVVAVRVHLTVMEGRVVLLAL